MGGGDGAGVLLKLLKAQQDGALLAGDGGGERVVAAIPAVWGRQTPKGAPQHYAKAIYRHGTLLLAATTRDDR
jgi:hypothetical protein